MVRPRRHRWVRHEPGVTYFKPQGVKLRGLERIDLNIEELEAVRLKDHQNLDQNTAAMRMKVSQPTFHRIYSDARAKIARALVEGLAIKIHGGVYKMPGRDRTGPQGQGPRTGRGQGPCGRGRGVGRGQGRGFGWRRTADVQQLTKEEEKRLLEEERQEIEKRLKEIEE
ncbi:DUF134 domain-containing protein [Candidatus Woesearchaeota archaeon]|nr:DUF134 domain-containing protein [Candidatus Woesearchaeota archaeon]